MNTYVEQLLSVPVSFSSVGDNTIIPDPGDGRYIAVDFISFFPVTATTLTFKMGTTTKTGAMSFDAKQTLTWDNAAGNEHGVIHGVQGEAFIINSSAAVQVSGYCNYRLIGN